MAGEEGAAAGQYDQGYNEPFLSKANATEEGISAETAPEHGYNYGTRPWRDVSALVVFVIVSLASIGLGIFAIVNSNSDFFLVDQAQYERHNGTCIVHGSSAGLLAGARNRALQQPGKASLFMSSSQDELFVRALVFSAAATLVLSLPVAWGLLWLLRNYTKELVYASLPLLLLVPILLNITWFVACFSDETCKELDLSVRIIIFVLVFLVIGLLLWFIYAARDRIELSINIIRTAAHSLFNNMKLLLVLPALFFGAAIFLAALATFVVFAYANGQVVVDAPDNPQRPVSCVWKTREWVPAYLALAVLAFYWAGALLHQLQSYVISGTVSQWYFAPADSSTKGAIRRTLGTAFGPSLGTVCFAGLILAIVRMIRAAVRNSRNNQGQEGILAIIVRCCLQYLLSIVEFVTNFTICFAAITGESFCTSASRTYELLKRNALSTLFVESIAGNLLSSVVFVSTAIFSLVVFGVVYLSTDLESGPSLITALLCWVLLGVIVGLFSQVLSQIVDVVYICYAMDKDVGYVSKEEVHDVYVLLPATGANDQPSLAVARP